MESAATTASASKGKAAPTVAPAAKVQVAVSTKVARAPIQYRVQQGDTLFALARRYGTSVAAIAGANALSSVHRIRQGQVLTIPGGGASGTAAGPRTPADRARLTWPARGVLTSRFGWRWRRHHDGIDLASARGTPIYAARSGRVTRAGWYGGYGLTVIIDHGNGLTTLYGHTSRIVVREGQQVARGQRIARVGCTGACTGSHLHFEVRKHGRAINPLIYLR